MKIGVHFVNFSLPGSPGSLAPTLAATARAAEEGGCSTFTVMDHWFQMEHFATAGEPMLEGYTSLGFLAGQTERMTLGLLVTGVTYRHPGLLAKVVTTLDVLSGDAPGSGSGRPGTSVSTGASGCPSHRWASGSSGWRRRCRSACRCGATTTGPSTAATTSWPRPSAPHRRSAGPGRASWSGEAASARPCASWPATPTPATSSPPTLPSSPTSWRSSTATARPSAATPPTSSGPFSASPRPSTTPTPFWRRWRSTPRSGSTWSRSCPPDRTRLGWVTRLGEETVPRLSEIGPS